MPIIVRTYVLIIAAPFPPQKKKLFLTLRSLPLCSYLDFKILKVNSQEIFIICSLSLKNLQSTIQDKKYIYFKPLSIKFIMMNTYVNYMIRFICL